MKGLLGKCLGALQPKTMNVTVYRPKKGIHPTNADVFNLVIHLSQHPPFHIGVEVPEFPCITERQFKALPSYLQILFEPMQTVIRKSR